MIADLNGHVVKRPPCLQRRMVNASKDATTLTHEDRHIFGSIDHFRRLICHNFHSLKCLLESAGTHEMLQRFCQLDKILHHTNFFDLTFNKSFKDWRHCGHFTILPECHIRFAQNRTSGVQFEQNRRPLGLGNARRRSRWGTNHIWRHLRW